MEYTIQKLASMAGVSTRTLRYYDQIQMLSPKRLNHAGYRIYGEQEVDRLQQILFYREMGLELLDIKKIMDSPGYHSLSALENHLQELQKKKDRLEKLIQTVTKTIQYERGELAMADTEKFEGFKKDLIDENERKYGKEIREKYGKDMVEKSNEKMMGLTKEQYDAMQNLKEQILEKLEEAVGNKRSPSGEEGREIANLHKQWLSYTWSSYSKEAHVGLVQMYVEDERFKKYYDRQAEGCAAFLRDAVTASFAE